MKAFIFCLSAVCLGQVALAQGTPVPKIGGSCPTGTVSSSGSCVPTGNTQVFLNPSGGSCPLGWIRSGNGNYCVSQ
jgi:hypothetical protein